MRRHNSAQQFQILSRRETNYHNNIYYWVKTIKKYFGEWPPRSIIYLEGQIFDRFLARFFDQVFDQIFGQGFDQGLGEGKNHKYSVQYYPDQGKQQKT